MRIHRILAFMSRKWLAFLLIIISTAQSDDQTGIPQAGLLCISDCATCPVICAPPPPPSTDTQKPPPPPSSDAPKPPPPPPEHHRPPPQTYYMSSPPPASSSPPPSPPHHPPPPSYTSSGGTTPPPPSGYVYVPGINQLPPGVGQKNYTYPYYYFYTSNASFSHQDSIFFMLLLSFQVLFLAS